MRACFQKHENVSRILYVFASLRQVEVQPINVPDFQPCALGWCFFNLKVYFVDAFAVWRVIPCLQCNMNLVECMYNLRELVKVDEILRKNSRFLGGNVMLNKPISKQASLPISSSLGSLVRGTLSPPSLLFSLVVFGSFTRGFVPCYMSVLPGLFVILTRSFSLDPETLTQEYLKANSQY